MPQSSKYTNCLAGNIQKKLSRSKLRNECVASCSTVSVVMTGMVYRYGETLAYLTHGLALPKALGDRFQQRAEQHVQQSLLSGQDHDLGGHPGHQPDIAQPGELGRIDLDLGQEIGVA